MSHPSWVCGLKPCNQRYSKSLYDVTPFVGVWIETLSRIALRLAFTVTPFVGVWIETHHQHHYQ